MGQGLYMIPDKATLNMIAKMSANWKLITETLSAMTAGTAYTGTLKVAPILNSTRRWHGDYDDSGFIPDGSVFVLEVETEGEVDTNGDYYIDYYTGYYKVKAGASATPTVTYYAAEQRIATIIDGGTPTSGLVVYTFSADSVKTLAQMGVTLSAAMIGALITIETNPVRFGFGGTVDQTNGHKLFPGDTLIMDSYGQLAQFRACNAVAGQNAKLVISTFQ